MIARATPAMSEATPLPFAFPAKQHKEVIAAFDGGWLRLGLESDRQCTNLRNSRIAEAA